MELVANRPIVHHALDWALEASDAGVVFVGDADALIDLRASVATYSRWFTQIDYVVCPLDAGIPAVLKAAAPYVGDAACLLQPADGLLDEPVEPLLALLQSSDLVLLSRAAQRVGAVPGFSPAVTDPLASDAHSVAVSEATEGLVEVGLFAPGALASAADLVTNTGPIDLGVAGECVEHDGAQVSWCKATGWHRYRAHGADLLDLNRVTLDRLTGSVTSERLTQNNLIEGKVHIDASALISGSTIAGPVVIGPDAVVTNSYVGPYTSIGAGARIIGSEVERSIVSSGASVLHVGSRLVTSLVGRDTRVFTDFSLPRGLRLWVGDGEDLAIC